MMSGKKDKKKKKKDGNKHVVKNQQNHITRDAIATTGRDVLKIDKAQRASRTKLIQNQTEAILMNNAR